MSRALVRINRNDARNAAKRHEPRALTRPVQKARWQVQAQHDGAHEGQRTAGPHGWATRILTPREPGP